MSLSGQNLDAKGLLDNLADLDADSPDAVETYFDEFGKYIEKITDELAFEKFKQKYLEQHGTDYTQSLERFTYTYSPDQLAKINAIKPLIDDFLENRKKTPEDIACVEEFKKYCKAQNIEFEQIREILAYTNVIQTIGSDDVDKRLFAELEASEVLIGLDHRNKLNALVSGSDGKETWAGRLSKLESLLIKDYKKQLIDKIRFDPGSFDAIMFNLTPVMSDGENIISKDIENQKINFAVEFLLLAEKVSGVNEEHIKNYKDHILKYVQHFRMPIAKNLLGQLKDIKETKQLDVAHHGGSTATLARALHFDPQPAVIPRDELLARQIELVQDALEKKKNNYNPTDKIYISIEVAQSKLNTNDITTKADLDKVLINLNNDIPRMKRGKININEIRRDIMPVTMKDHRQEELIEKVKSDIDQDQRYGNNVDSSRARVDAKKAAVNIIKDVKIIGDLKSIAKTCIPADGAAQNALREIIRKESKTKLPPQQKESNKPSLGERVMSKLGLKR